MPVNRARVFTPNCLALAVALALSQPSAHAAAPVAPTLSLGDLNGPGIPSVGFTLTGKAERDRSGVSVSSAGDINGDGIDDLIIGASGTDNYAGESYVVFGGTEVGDTGTLSLSSLNGTNGFALTGKTAGDRSGDSVSGAGDINGDGFDDLIIGAFSADPLSLIHI